jgi:hypothetical protein
MARAIDSLDPAGSPLPAQRNASQWVGERLRDGRQWALNLIRDFSRRSGRLAGTVAALGRVHRPQQVGAWLFHFGCHLFDLVGGPEAAQLVAHLFVRTSPLTAAEVAAAEAVLGKGAIRFGDVRIAEGGLLELVFRLNKKRAFATWHTVNLPEEGRHGRSNSSLLVHELTHVYQYERVGTVYIGQALQAQRRLGRRAYDYGGPAGLLEARAAGKRYNDYNREQQGQIAQDYYLLRQRREDTAAYEPFISELKAGAF